RVPLLPAKHTGAVLQHDPPHRSLSARAKVLRNPPLQPLPGVPTQPGLSRYTAGQTDLHGLESRPKQVRLVVKAGTEGPRGDACTPHDGLSRRGVESELRKELARRDGQSRPGGVRSVTLCAAPGR